jgi:hypothetical protein
MNIRKNDLKTETDKTFALNEIAEKHFKYTAAKTRKIKSENQAKGKVRAITITILNSTIASKKSGTINITVLTFNVK